MFRQRDAYDALKEAYETNMKQQAAYQEYNNNYQAVSSSLYWFLPIITKRKLSTSLLNTCLSNLQAMNSHFSQGTPMPVWAPPPLPPPVMFSQPALMGNANASGSPVSALPNFYRLSCEVSQIQPLFWFLCLKSKFRPSFPSNATSSTFLLLYYQ